MNCLKRASESLPQIDILPDYIENLKTLDLNIFPQYGDIKIKSRPKENNNEKEEDCPSYEKKIELPKIDYEKFYQDLEMWVEKTREEFPIIKSKILTIEKLKLKENENREIMHVDPNSTEGLRKCNEYLKIVNQVGNEFEPSILIRHSGSGSRMNETCLSISNFFSFFNFTDIF